MTTTWKITPDWQGQTVAVLASGPNMSQEVADALREHRRIVVNHTHRLAPDADMLVAMDAHWPQEFRDFAGLRVTGVMDDDLDALYIGPRWERVQIAPGHEIEIHDSGLTAVRISAAVICEPANGSFCTTRLRCNLVAFCLRLRHGLACN